MRLNGYERRKLVRTNAAKARRQLQRQDHMMEVHEALLEYEKVYTAYYKVPARASYSNGWVLVNGFRYRIKKIKEMTNHLYASIHEQELNAPEQSA